MKLFINIAVKRIYLFLTIALNYRKKVGFQVCKKENFARLQVHRKRKKSASASRTPASHIKRRAERSSLRQTFIRPDG